jgi:hypothetical protein
MQPSPYTPGEVARAVPGRAIQLAEIDERLSVLADLGRLVGRIRVDHAPRGFGKTSLLREYQRRAEARGLLSVWVTAGEEAGLVAQICPALASATETSGDRARAAVGRLESVELTLGVPGLAQVSGTRSVGPRVEPRGARAFEAAIRDKTDGVGGVVVLIDEIQAADEVGLRTLVYAWQHLQAEGADVPAAVFAAGLPSAPERIAAVVTFSERIAYRPLGTLGREAEEIAVVGPARALGVRWTEEAVELALSIAQGYPYAVQLIADAAWTAAGRPDPGHVVDVRAVERGRSVMQADLEALFRARWAGCTAFERRLLGAMADLGAGPVARATLAQAMHATPNSLSAPRARLIDKGLIQPADRGLLQFTMPGFAEFVRGNGGE